MPVIVACSAGACTPVPALLRCLATSALVDLADPSPHPLAAFTSEEGVADAVGLHNVASTLLTARRDVVERLRKFDPGEHQLSCQEYTVVRGLAVFALSMLRAYNALDAFLTKKASEN